MATVQYMELVDNVRGKFCKKNPNSPIFARRSDSGTKYVYHVHNPFTGEPTAAQVAVRQRFAQNQAKVTEALNDPQQSATYMAEFKAQKKYPTLRGYVFAQLMAAEGL